MYHVSHVYYRFLFVFCQDKQCSEILFDLIIIICQALSFNDNALRRLYSDPKVREAVYQCSSDFARSIEAYLKGLRD